MEKSISIVGETLMEEARELRLCLKIDEELVGKESRTYKKVERRLKKVIKQASRIGLEV